MLSQFQIRNYWTSALVAITLCVASAAPQLARADESANGFAEPVPARIVDLKESRVFKKLINDTSEVYRAIVDGEQGRVSESVIKKALCVAVVPNVVTGALMVGGAHGDGVASCKKEDGTWSMPDPIALTQGSFGLQAGAKNADLVLFFQTPEAVRQLKSGEFNLGSDMSAVAGDYDGTVDNSDENIIVFSRSNGIFLGVSIGGSKFLVDEKNIEKFYSSDAKTETVPQNTNSDDSLDSDYYKKFTSLLPS